ncbi:hypothetical protein AGMMS4956_03630 [Bacteroidia bacterium]|nr:hypothetical protein AGMMS4956_03630 [Bacteroidia bacterium]
MKKTFKNLLLMGMFGSLVFCLSCKKDKNEPAGGDKPVIENLAANPSASVKYGDVVALTGKFTDKVGLKSYTVKISNADGDLWETTNLLTGTAYNLNLDVAIPLPQNASAGDVQLSLTLKNSGNSSATEELTFSSVAVPTFTSLYLVVGSKTFTLDKVDGVFVVEDLFAANAAGKIYANSNKTGLFWGTTSSEITALGNDDITFGKAAEAYLKVTFDPITFAINVEEQTWTPINEPLYILGDISGRWQDAEITGEINDTKMQGYQLGDKKYWTWTPPSTEIEEAGNWWGAIKINPFRFKIGGAEQYILYRGNTISVENADDNSAAFATSVGGHVTIKVFHDGTTFNKVSIEEILWEDGSTVRSLEYLLNGALNINGTSVPTALTFAGTPLSLKTGTAYVFEGTVSLTKEQDITAIGADLTTANPDRDVFTGKGNATWHVVGNTGQYLIRIDPFASTIYACLLGGYPDVIYMDGWSWAKAAGDPGNNWNPENRLALQRTSTESYIYEATFHYRGWGGDVNFWYAPYTDADINKKRFLLKYFAGVTPFTDTNVKVIDDSAEHNDYLKVTIDLKDGFTEETTEESGPDGNVFVITPTNGRQFTVTFTPIPE